MCIRDRVKRAQHQCHFVQTANDILNRFQEVLSMLFSDQLYQALKQHSVCSRVSWRYLKSHCGFHSFYGSDLPDIFLELNWDPLVSAYDSLASSPDFRVIQNESTSALPVLQANNQIIQNTHG